MTNEDPNEEVARNLRDMMDWIEVQDHLRDLRHKVERMRTRSNTLTTVALALACFGLGLLVGQVA